MGAIRGRRHGSIGAGASSNGAKRPLPSAQPLENNLADLKVKSHPLIRIETIILQSIPSSILPQSFYSPLTHGCSQMLSMVILFWGCGTSILRRRSAQGLSLRSWGKGLYLPDRTFLRVLVMSLGLLGSSNG